MTHITSLQGKKIVDVRHATDLFGDEFYELIGTGNRLLASIRIYDHKICDGAGDFFEFETLEGKIG